MERERPPEPCRSSLISDKSIAVHNKPDLFATATDDAPVKPPPAEMSGVVSFEFNGKSPMLSAEKRHAMGDLVTLAPAEEAQGRWRQMLRTALGPTITEVPATPSNDIHGKDTADASVAHEEDELWSLKTVVARTGLSRSSIYSYRAGVVSAAAPAGSAPRRMASVRRARLDQEPAPI
jgi:hypothetical protein